MLSIRDVRAMDLEARAALTPRDWAHMPPRDQEDARALSGNARRDIERARDRKSAKRAATRVVPGTEAHYQCGVMCRTFRHGAALEKRYFRDLQADHTSTDALDRWIKTANVQRAIQQTMVAVWGIEHLRERAEEAGEREIDMSTEDLDRAIEGIEPAAWDDDA